MNERRYEVVVEAHEDAPVSEYFRDILSQLDNVSGIISVNVERKDVTERDISEVYRILGDLSKHELERLADSIDAYTEDDE